MTSFGVTMSSDQMRRDMDAETAQDLLGRGVATLCSGQANAPVELLTLIDPSRFDSANLGPDTTSPKVLQRISSSVVSHGLRQLLVEGAELRWISGLPGLVSDLETEMSACTEQPQNLLDQMRRVLHWRVDQEARVLTTTKPLTDEFQAERHLVPSYPRTKQRSWGYIDVDEASIYKEVGPSWRQFYEHFVDCQDAVSAVTKTGLATGSRCCGVKAIRLMPRTETPQIIVLRFQRAHQGGEILG